MSYFSHLEKAPTDSILGLARAFKEDTRPCKVNLGIGVYQNEKGSPQVLSSVRKAEALLLEKQLAKEYLPISGNALFIQELLQLIFGKNNSKHKEGTLFGVQTLGGTGALRVGAEFLARSKISSTIHLSQPSWPNHTSIFTQAGMQLSSYPYYNAKTAALDFSGMCRSIEEMAPRSTLLLQPCCHNPTGIAPSFEQWKILSEIIKKKGLIPFFDLAYQGFDKGIEEDGSVVRYFAEQGHEMLVASSCSKNFGLYGERVGLLAILCSDKKTAEKTESQVCLTIRGSYSMPPLQGSRIVTTILTSSELRKEWEEELASMRQRIQTMRKALAEELLSKGGGQKQHFSSLLEQTGMFSYTGISEEAVKRLKEEFAIYMPPNGRVNIAGLNPLNLQYVIQSLLTIS